MIVKFDSLNRMETPTLTLCNPGCTLVGGHMLTNVVGILADHQDEEIVFNFNAPSELSFRIFLSDRKDGYLRTMYEGVVERRLIFVEDIGFFVITDINESTDKDGVYKDVTAKSADVEAEQKGLPYIKDGTYRFVSDENNKGLLETVVEVIPLWEIGHVDKVVAERWRSFEDVSDTTNCLAFLTGDVQQAYECIIIMDPINRIINVYDQSNYVHETSIHLTYDDFVNSIKVKSSDSDLYTALSVKGGDDDEGISFVNPTGSNVIYNFDYYLDWMSESLREKVRAWKEDITNEEDQYYQANLMLYGVLNEINDVTQEISRLNTQRSLYYNCRENIEAEHSTELVPTYNESIKASGGTEIDITDNIRDTKNQITAFIATCDARISSKSAHLNNLNSTKESLQEVVRTNATSRLALDKYFTSKELQELQCYIFEGNYDDEFVATTDTMSFEERFQQRRDLYSRSLSQLERCSMPTKEFDIDVENIVFDKRFSGWTSQLETGCLINAELKPGDVAALFLSAITLNYEDHKLTLKFGNRYNSKFDTKSLFDDALGKVNKSANTLSFIKDLIYPIKTGELNRMQEAIKSSRNLTMQSALASDNESVVIDGTGYTGRSILPNGEYDPRQVKIIGKNIVFTDDNWETSKVAIGEIILPDGSTTYGVNAETLIGETILGSNLIIVDAYGNELLSVVDGKISSAVTDFSNKAEIRLAAIEQNADSVEIKVDKLMEDPDGATHLDTGTGYRFDENGLSIHRDQEEMSSLIDNTGMRVLQQNGEDSVEVLTATNSGVNAINLRSRQYLIVGKHARFEDYVYNNEERTACFYIETPNE